MFVVLFEVQPHPERFDEYLGIAKLLRPELEAIDGFIDNTRFASARTPGRLLSLSTWRDEKSLIRWRTHATHHDQGQRRGRFEIFADYRLRVAEVTQDSHPPAGITLRQNYNRKAPRLALQAGRHAHARQFRRMRKVLRTLKGYTGRVLRDIRRQSDAVAQGPLRAKIRNRLDLVTRLLQQTPKSTGKVYAPPCVTGVAARIGSEPLGAQEGGRGSIRTAI